MFENSANDILSFPASVQLIRQSPLGLALVFFGLYWLIKALRPVDGTRPPLARYWIPWLGSAIDIGKDPDRFFNSMTKSLGPVFRVKVLGREKIFVTSPSLISTIYRDSQSFRFLDVRLEMGETIFSIRPDVGRQQYMVETFMPEMHHALLPGSLGPMVLAYIASAHDFIRSTVANMNGSSVPLVSLIIPPAYHAAAHAAFGKNFPAEESYALFRTFDDSFALLAANVPKIMLSKSLKAWDKLVDLIVAYIDRVESESGEEVGHFVRVALRGREGGWTSRDIATVLGSQLWALQANAVFAAYWMVALSLERGEGLAPLVEEVDNARRLWQAAHPSKPLGTEFFEDLASDSKSLPLVTSAIQETLRYTSQSFSIRRVTRPVQLGGYELREGDEVVCATRYVHVDDQIHSDAATFDIRRYLEPPKPMKDGRLVPNHTMPFGGGVSKCEGRFFAISELKMFMAILLTYATVEADPASSSRPTFSWDRQGIFQPRGDMRVIVQKRQL
ncbi:cytochrome P450 [Trametes punicea]|nr:cytochrome P450 [Trametes punicea]